jgi:predicted kinase
MLIIVCGLPGVGKTNFAQKFAERLDAEYVNTDRIRMSELPKRTYSEEEKAEIYKKMATKAKELLENSKNVVLDATFYLEKFRKMMQDVANDTRNEFFVMKCVLEESELKQRMEKRKAEKTESEADFEVYLKVKEQFESMDIEHIEINTALPVEDNIKNALSFIGR